MPASEISLSLNTGPTVDLLSANVAHGATSGATPAVDFGTPTPLEVGYTVKLNCSQNANNLAYLKIMWSHNNSDFCDNLNAETITVISCAQLLLAKKTGSFVVKARYAKFQLQNLSGGVIANASTELKLWDMFGAAT